MPGPTRPMSDMRRQWLRSRSCWHAPNRSWVHNYVFVEALALVQHRLGNKVAAALDIDFQALRVEWVDGLMWQCLEWPCRSVALS